MSRIVGLQYIYDKVAHMEKRQEEWVTEEAQIKENLPLGGGAGLKRVVSFTRFSV